MMSQLGRFLSLAVSVGVIGIVGGALGFAFNASLLWVTQLRQDHALLILFLPLAAFVSVHWVQMWGGRLPFATTWLGALISHGFGASVGREGAALELGALSARRLRRLWPLKCFSENTASWAGMAATLSASFGVPITSCIFAWEFNRAKRSDLGSLPKMALASYISFIITNYLYEWQHIAHQKWPQITLTELLRWQFIFFMPLVAIFCGVFWLMFQRLRIISQRLLDGLSRRLFRSDRRFRAMLGGAIVSLMLIAWGEQYAGLGLNSIERAFVQTSSIWQPLIKAAVTAMSLAAGFGGGEFTPILFMGAGLGSALSALLHQPPQPLAMMATASLVACGYRAPWAGACLALELSGWPCALPALAAAHLGLWVCGAQDRKQT